MYLFDLAECDEWLSDNPRDKLLWLSAPSGFGKSVVSAYAIDALSQRFPNSAVAYFFCKDSEAQREAHQIVRSFLSQLIDRYPQIHNEVKTKWESNKSIADLTATIEDLSSTLIAVTETLSCPRVFFVVDGINECPHRSLDTIIRFLNLLRHSNNMNIRIMLATQPTSEIASHLHDSIKCVLDRETNSDTIDLYIEHTLDYTLKDRFQKCNVQPNEYFKTQHNGMFIWVSTMLECLGRADSDDDFEAILSEVPDSINDLYLKILKRFEKDLIRNEKAWLKEILMWVTLSQRALNLAELETGIRYSRKLRSGKAIVSRLDNIEKTLSKYGALLEIVKLENQGDVKFVSLSHDSVKLFLTNEDECKSEFYIDKNISNSLMAAACSQYLIAQNIPMIDDFTLPVVQRRKIDQEHPFFSYASVYWSTHLTTSSQSGLTTTSQAMEILELSRFRTWLLNNLKYDCSLLEDGSTLVPQAMLTSLHGVNKWLDDHDMTFQPKNGRLSTIQISETSSELLNILREAVIQIWLSLEPADRLSSESAFTLAQKLVNEETKKVMGPVELAALVNVEIDQGRWHANIGHAFAHDYSSSEALQLAAQHYRLSRSYQLDSRSQAGIAHCLSDVLFRYCQLTDSVQNLEEGIECGRTAVEMLPEENRWLPRCLIFLAALYSIKFRLSQNLSDIDDAIGIARRAVKITPDAHIEKVNLERNLALFLCERYSVTNAQSEIDEATEILERAVTLTSKTNVWRSQCRDALVDIYRTRIMTLGSVLEDIDSVISHSRQAILEAPSESEKARSLMTLGAGLFHKYSVTRDLVDLDGAIDCIKRIMYEYFPSVPPEEVYTGVEILANAYGHTKTVNDISILLDHLKEFLAGCLDKRVKVFTAFMIEKMTLIKFDDHPSTGVEELVSAISFGKQALDISRQLNDPVLIQLSAFHCLITYQKIFNLPWASITLQELEEAIDLGQYLIAMKPPPAQQGMEGSAFLVAYWLVLKAECTGSLACAQESVNIAEQMLRKNPRMLATIRCVSSLMRFRFHDSYSDLKDALRQVQAAQAHPLATSSPRHKAVYTYLHAHILYQMHRATGWTNKLDKCIEDCRSLVQSPGPRSEQGRVRGGQLVALCGLLQLRAKSTHSLSELDEAIRCGIDALSCVDGNSLLSVCKAFWASIVSEAFLLRYEWTHTDKDLNSAIQYQKNAMDWTPEGHPEHVKYLTLYRKLL